MRVLPGIGIYNLNLELTKEVGPYYLPITIESIAGAESVAPSSKSGAGTLREESLQHPAPEFERLKDGLHLRKKVGEQKSEAKFSFQGNPEARAPAKPSEKSSTGASSSYKYFLISETSRKDAETANFERRNIPQEFSAAARYKQTESQFQNPRYAPAVDKQVETPILESEFLPRRVSRPRQPQGYESRSREPLADRALSRNKPTVERPGQEAYQSYYRRRPEAGGELLREIDGMAVKDTADRSTSRVRAAQYVPLDRARKESAGEIYSPLGEQEANDFIKLNTSSEKPKRRESVLDRIEKEILKREGEREVDKSTKGSSNIQVSKSGYRQLGEQQYRVGVGLGESESRREAEDGGWRSRGRSAHREHSKSKATEEGVSRSKLEEERREGVGKEVRGSGKGRSRKYLYEEKVEEQLGGREHRTVLAEAATGRRTPGSGSKMARREGSPPHTKTDQVMSTDFMRHGPQHDSSGNLIATMSPVHSSIRNSQKSRKQE